MRLDAEAIKRRCEARGMTLTVALARAGVSRTAYYSLLRRETVLPGSILKLAEALNATPSELVDDRPAEEARARRRLRESKRIVARYPGSSFENIWHTLVLLDEPPEARLQRALRRGRRRAV